MGNGYKAFVGKLLTKRTVGIPRYRWENLKEIGHEGMNWIQLAYGRVQWAGFYEPRDIRDTLKDEECLEQLNDHQFLMNTSSWGQMINTGYYLILMKVQQATGPDSGPLKSSYHLQICVTKNPFYGFGDETCGRGDRRTDTISALCNHFIIHFVQCIKAEKN
jgi:hypothetical protein